VEGPAAAYGYDVRLHTIRSFRKVTVWGVTFAVADLEGIIEETLPARSATISSSSSRTTECLC
jgi:hypothetical protein